MIKNDILRSLLVSSITILSLSACISDRETQLYEPEESTLRIAAAIIVKNSECGGSQSLILPVLFSAERIGVDLCVNDIMKLDCGTWAGNDPTPPICKAIVADFF